MLWKKDRIWMTFYSIDDTMKNNNIRTYFYNPNYSSKQRIGYRGKGIQNKLTITTASKGGFVWRFAGIAVQN